MTLTLFTSRLRLPQGHIFWREVGRGVPLVFLHGSWTDGEQWRSLYPHLATHHRCLMPDLLGFGNSALSYSSITTQVDWLAAYLESLRLDGVYLVAHSLGAWVATRYALTYPEQVKGLILMAPEGVEVPGTQWVWERRLAGRKGIWAMLLQWLSPVAQVVGQGATVRRLLAQRQVLLQFPAACRLLFQRRPAEIAAEMVEDRLVELAMPVLLLQGQRDSDRARAATARFASFCPQSQIQTLPGTLAAAMAHSEVWAQTMAQFLQAVVVSY